MGVEETEWCWLNGQILPMSEARVSVEDRGFQFADGVYEAMRIYRGKPFAMSRHLDRLENSCRGLKLSLPIDRASLASEMLKLVKHSGVRDGLLYLQLTRGVAKRNHTVPIDSRPTLLFYARPLPPIVLVQDQPGAKLISVPDDRWRKCWIKAIGLTANIMARTEAANAGADEAVFVDENGVVAECTTSNLLVVIDRALVTHPVGSRVLPGVTRDVVLECARSAKIKTDERPLHAEEARNAQEVFITSTTRQMMWVKTWDDQMIANGRCGPITRILNDTLDALIQRETRSNP